MHVAVSTPKGRVRSISSFKKGCPCKRRLGTTIHICNACSSFEGPYSKSYVHVVCVCNTFQEMVRIWLLTRTLPISTIQIGHDNKHATCSCFGHLGILHVKTLFDIRLLFFKTQTSLSSLPSTRDVGFRQIGGHAFYTTLVGNISRHPHDLCVRWYLCKPFML